MEKRSKTKFVPADAFLGRFSKQDRAAIDARARELIAEEMTLRDLRKALALTQTQLGNALHIGQEQVSRLEQRSDLLLSTLASYIDAMGGKLRLLVEFPDRPPVAIANIGDMAGKAETRGKQRRKSRRDTKGMVA